MSLPPYYARLCLAALVILVVGGLGWRRAIPAPPRDPASIDDVQLQLYTIERIRAGESYYWAVGEELRKHDYPTAPIWNWRTPLHYKAVAVMSVEGAGQLLFGLSIVLIFTGALVYTQYSPARGIVAGLILAITMAPAMLPRPGAVVFPERWAGALIGLSLNAYIGRHWATGALLGIVALFVRELVLPYAICCSLLALRGRRSKEAFVWLAGGLLYIVYFSLHALRAWACIQAGDLIREQSYVQWLGLPFVFMTLHVHGALAILPESLTPLAAAMGLAAAIAPSAPPQLRVGVLAYFAAFLMVGQPFNSYWGYLTATIWGHAFVHAPEGLRTLFAATRSRRTKEEMQRLRDIKPQP